MLEGIKAFYLKPLTIFTKISVLGFQMVSEYAPDIATTIPFLKNVLNIKKIILQRFLDVDYRAQTKAGQTNVNIFEKDVT